MTRLLARAASAALAAAALLALAACGPTGTDPTTVEPTAPGAYPESTAYPDIPVAAPRGITAIDCSRQRSTTAITSCAVLGRTTAWGMTELEEAEVE